MKSWAAQTVLCLPCKLWSDLARTGDPEPFVGVPTALVLQVFKEQEPGEVEDPGTRGPRRFTPRQMAWNRLDVSMAISVSSQTCWIQPFGGTHLSRLGEHPGKQRRFLPKTFIGVIYSKTIQQPQASKLNDVPHDHKDF